MQTKSRHTKPKGQRDYVVGASRGARSVATLRNQMDDLERGERMKAARKALHLTQPAVLDLFEEIARRNGWEPAQPGDRPITLRGLQSWEAGGGIKWDNAKILAEVLGLDVNYMMTGRDEDQPTPDLSLAQVDVVTELAAHGVEDQLARIEQQLAAASEERESLRKEIDEQNKLLDRQSAILERIETLVRVLDGAILSEQDEVAGTADALPELPPPSELGPQERERPVQTSDDQDDQDQDQQRKTA